MARLQLLIISATIHKVNEHVLAEDLNKLTIIYFKVIEKLLSA